MDEQLQVKLSHRNALLCALIIGACVLLTIPALAMPVNDGFSYTKSAFDYAQTGRLLYNGWSTAIVGWQAIWGAVFVKLFGYSFTAVRLSVLPFAAGSVYLLYLILARFGANAWNAVFGALALGLSPMFIPLAACFMTDVPALFCILLCLYVYQRAFQASCDRSAICWLVIATVSSMLGGTVRQVVWLGALVMVPSAVWLVRTRRRPVAALTVLWPISLVSIFAFMHWFGNQQYVLPTSRGSSIEEPALLRLSRRMLFFFLSLLLFCLPILVASLGGIADFPPHAHIAGRRAMLYLCGLLGIVGTRLPLHSSQAALSSLAHHPKPR